MLDYPFWTRYIERLVREAAADWYDADEFEERLEPLAALLMRRASGFTYSEQLARGYLTEIKRYVRAGKFKPEDRMQMLAALSRLHAAASFEARP